MHKPTHYEMSLDLPAVHRGVRLARNVTRHFTRMWGMTDRDIESLVLVVSELLANTIDHGGGGAAMSEAELENDVRMKLTFRLTQVEWSLAISDEGGGDPSELRAILTAEVPDLEDERGRGMFLIARMVDQIDVEKSANGRGLTIIARKKLSPA